MKAFEDHFSSLAGAYARFRPRYPAELFAFVAGLARRRRLALDCATGSGQAAAGLSPYFETVAACDASRQQLSQFEPQPCPCWVGRAERLPLASGSVDLLTVAQGAHWFDLDAFYPEVERVLRPGGVLAIWGYISTEIDPAVNHLVVRLIHDILKPYWSQRMLLLFDHYRSLDFPYRQMAVPEFAVRAEWTLNDLIGFVNSWSALKPFMEARGHHPIEEIYDELLRAWGDPNQVHTVQFPIFMRVARIG